MSLLIDRSYTSLWRPHLFIVFDLILQNDPIGSVRELPCQGDGVSGDILRLDGSHRWRSWRNYMKNRKRKITFLYNAFSSSCVINLFMCSNHSVSCALLNPSQMLLLLWKSNSGTCHKAITFFSWITVLKPGFVCSHTWLECVALIYS